MSCRQCEHEKVCPGNSIGGDCTGDYLFTFAEAINPPVPQVGSKDLLSHFALAINYMLNEIQMSVEDSLTDIANEAFEINQLPLSCDKEFNVVIDVFDTSISSDLLICPYCGEEMRFIKNTRFKGYVAHDCKTGVTITAGPGKRADVLKMFDK